MILIMGVPGAGKSVQSELLQKNANLKWISTGKLLRETGDEETKMLIESGQLVSDELAESLVTEHVGRTDSEQIVLLDGFPRTAAQAHWLGDYVVSVDRDLSLLLFLDLPLETALARLSSRGRKDDAEDILATRVEEAKKIEPALEALQEMNIPRENIDASGTVEDIHKEILNIIDVYKS